MKKRVSREVETEFANIIWKKFVPTVFETVFFSAKPPPGTMSRDLLRNISGTELSTVYRMLEIEVLLAGIDWMK
jgi:hypothetical protein